MTTSTGGSSHIRSIEDLRGPAGRLEAVLNTGSDAAPYAAIVCHPHPKGGGTMHNKVVYHAMKTLSSFGLPVVRFNFRGVGLSEGTHDDGHGERDDVRAVLDWVEQNLARPILLAGFSFGSSVGMRAACGDPRVAALVALGLPVHAEGRDYSYHFLESCPQPKLFLSGDSDIYGPQAQVEEVIARAAEPKHVEWVAGADHFFQGTAAHPGSKLPVMQQHLSRWLQQVLHLQPASAQEGTP
ncbi:MAG: alpha/beta hydrolase [Acidobacteriota bacterium]|nr:alpha/beta hydrolase [Acidobacteriota bacterium]